MILFLTDSHFSNWVNICQRGRVSLGPITYKTNKYEQICNNCLRGKVEMKLDVKVRGLEFKSRGVQNNKKNWGVRSRDRVRVRGSIGLGIGGSIGIGSGLMMSTLFLLRNTPPPPQKKKIN